MSARTNAHSAFPSESGGELSSLVALLRRRAEAQPARRAYTFLVDGETQEQHITYGELDRQARAIGAWLQSNGCYTERVLLLYPSGLQFIAAFFGCLYAGAIAVSAHLPRRNHSLSRLQAIAADAEAKFVLATTPVLSKLDAFAEHVPYLKTMRGLATDQLEIGSGLLESWIHPPVQRETLAFLQYTSGSTATPRGVMVSHGNVLHNSAYINAGFAFTPQSTSLVWVPHFHDMGLIMGLMQPLVHGFHGIVMPPASFLQRPLRWLEAMSRYGVTHSGGPNSAYDLCVRRSTAEQRAQLDLSRWRVAYNGAEPVRRQTLERFAEAFAPCGFRWEAFDPAYGLAEATLKVTGGQQAEAPIFCTLDAEALGQGRVVETSADSPDARVMVGCGRADSELLVRIVHPETLVECLPEEIGEIWVAGPSIAKGYWNKPLETEQTFHARLARTEQPQFLRTGDLGFLREDELFVTGRLKDLIIINGRNHYPQDIELTVEQCHPAVRAGGCAAIALEAKDGEELAVVAEVERHFRPEREAAQVFVAIRRALAEEHELTVRHILLLKTGKLLKTTSGKVQRNACRAAFWAGSLESVAQWPSDAATSVRRTRQQGTVEESHPSEASSARAREPRTAEEIQAWLIDRIAAVAHIAPQAVNIWEAFASFGLGSVQNVSLSGELAEWLGRPLPPTLFYEYPTIASVAKVLAAAPPATDRAEQYSSWRPQSAVNSPEPIAIIGIGCRFPAAESPEAFWQLLRAGKDAITEGGAEQWRARMGWRRGQGAADKHAQGGFLGQVDQFDAHFFSISPREAPYVDPQQRLLLEVAWEALEAAGQAPAKLAGSQTGVFIGISSSDYYLLQQRSPMAQATYAATGSAHSIAANRLSYLLDLRGPSMAVDTACSSSLVAVHLACQSLQRGEARLALAGGVNLLLNPDVTDDLSRAGMLSADGRCKVFDAAADGYVRGEGCGIVILKRLSEALHDGDHVIAQIKASAINQDGRSNGLTAPNGLSQQAVIRQTLAHAGVLPAEIDFVETHGSGTALGDPIEVNSLISLLREGRAPAEICFLGSVKANIGHLEAAAGVAGLIKAALALWHREIPAQIHLRRLNPHIAINDTPFSVPTEPQPWPSARHPRRAGVSSFGFGGTNAHVLLEEAPPCKTTHDAPQRPLHLLTLSARSEQALQALARRYELFLQEHSQIALANICFTANTGRSHLAHRLAVVCASHEQCLDALGAFVRGQQAHGLYHSQWQNRQRPKVAFVFNAEPGAATDWTHDLYQTQPAFRDALAQCAVLLHAILELPPGSVPTDPLQLLAAGVEPTAARFAIQYALAQMWLSWGIAPAVLLGSGIGEYVAACVAGVCKPEEGLRLLLEFEPTAARVQFQPPRMPLISAQTGSALSAPEVMDLAYWRRRRQELKQEAAPIESRAQALSDHGCELFLAFGPAPGHLAASSEEPRALNGTWLSGRGDWSVLLATLARLYVKGVAVDWDRFDEHGQRRRVPLPTYPFERKRYWLDAPEDARAGQDEPQSRPPAKMDEPPATPALQRQERQQEQAASPTATSPLSAALPATGRRQEVLLTLSEIIADLLRMQADELDPYASFLELGADSIVLVNALLTIENRFGIEVSISQVFEQFTTIDALAAYIAQHTPGPTAQSEAGSAVSEPAQSAYVSAATQLALPAETRPAEPAESSSPLLATPEDKLQPESFSLPLTEAQQQLWLLAQIGEDASRAYQESVVIELTGALDVNLMHDALRALVNRHEALRTAIDAEGACQRILSALDIELPLIDLTARDEARGAAVHEWLENEARRAFDLTRPPLLRAAILKVAAARYLLVLHAHHIVTDSWSFSLLLQELATLYSAGCEQAAVELAQPMQFSEYLHELSGGVYLERLQQAESYWLRQFSSSIPALSLTASRPPVQTYQGSKISVRAETKLYSRLKAFSKQRGCTLFMTLLAGYAALLHRLTGQRELVVGIPVTGRFVAGSESVVGYCTHLLPVLSQLEAAPSFETFLQASRSRLLRAYDHQEYPFAKLIERLNPPRDVRRPPLLQTTFNLEPHPSVPKFAGLESGFVSAPVYYAKFDLIVNVLELNDELQLDFIYNTDLFAAAAIGRLADQFQVLLAGAMTWPEQQLERLPLLSEVERRRLLVEWNDTKAPLPARLCLHELVEEQARRRPQAPAVVCNRETLTYQELNCRANQLAHHLSRLGLKPEARVGICCERAPEMLIGLLGILKAGCAYVPLDPEYPTERLAYMLADAQACVLLTDQQQARLFTRTAARIINLSTLWPVIAAESTENSVERATPEQLAYVIYTSGSTGQPKGVQITHAAVVNLLAAVERAPGLGPSDTLLAVTTISFDIAALELFLPLTVGARLIIASREMARDGEQLAQALVEAEISMMQATPATWRLLLEAGWQGQAHLKILCGGEALPRPLAEELLARGASLWNMYGPTETTIWSATDRVEPGDGIVPIGRPLLNTELYVLDAQLQPVPVGSAGELYIAGAGLARGYLNRPELTAEKFIPHPFSAEPGLRLYRTGDSARYLATGQIELLGRLDHQVKLRGYRIELGEIEAALCAYPCVREAVVVLREQQPGDQRLVAYVVCAQERTPAGPELSAFLSQSLPEYMIPASFVFLAALPRYPNGKVNRAALPTQNGTQPTSGPRAALPQTQLEQAIARIWQEILKIDSVSLHDNFFDLGGHSLLLAQVHRKLRDLTGKEFSLIEMFRHPTVAALASYLNNGHDGYATRLDERKPVALRQPPRAAAETEVAIIGMAGRFPGARTVEEFWHNLRAGVESITFFTEEELAAQGVAPALLDDARYVKAGAILNDVDLFDAKFFGFSPREAELTDPQHRIFLECAWEALEQAGYDAERFEGAIGVYASAGINTYLLFNLAAHGHLLAPHSAYQVFIGNDKDFVPSRVSYKLNLKGPSVNIQTACSSSLVAVHTACQGLLTGACRMALAGGVSIKVPLKTGYLHDEQGIDSPDGHCRAFDARAAGTIFGSGVGIVVLKRLADALRDGDTIHAVIKGSAVNNDGAHKVSYTAPSVDGQAEVIRAALAAAQVEPDTIAYVEAHGTATHLGDPIEIAALTKAFGPDARAKGRCAIGSVKTNIGHLDTAAGIAGLIKTVLSLKHGELPPSLHFERPNPEIDFAASPFYVNDSLRQWERNGRPRRRAGVSSFGIGGTNAHVILEEPPTPVASSKSRPWQLLLLSAKTESALAQETANLAAHLSAEPAGALPDVAYTLQVGRKSFAHRRLIVCQDAPDALSSIERLDPKRVITQAAESGQRPVAFLFPGQGTQYVEMARELYQSELRFRQIVDNCAALLRPHLGLDLRRILYPDAGEQAAAAQQLQQTWLSQPALFVIEYALASLWMEWGIQPHAMLGHSIGEYTAACLAGLFSLEDGLALIAARGKLMQSLPGGAMLAVPLAEDETHSLLNEQLSLAAVNGAAQCVISGATAAIDRLEAELTQRGVLSTRLRTSHAFHSVMMEPIMERFAGEVARVQLKPPRRPYLSSLTGDWISADEAMNPHYWANQLRAPVRFADGLGKLLANPEQILLEVGPGQSLSAQVRRHARKTPRHVVVSSMRHPRDNDSDVAVLLTALGRLWLAGSAINWPAFYAGERRRRGPLPTYPFERQRYWIEPPQQEEAQREARPTLGKSSNLSQWFYLPCWKPTARPLGSQPGAAAQPGSACWLVFTTEHSFCSNLLSRLEAQTGARLIIVKMGAGFAQLNECAYVLNPERADDYRRLIDELRLKDQLPGKVLHLWNVSSDAEAQTEAHTFEHYQRTGFESLLWLGKSLGATNKQVELIVVSTNLQSVTGAETLRPEKATLLGPCKTIPQEYPHLTCRSLDLALCAPESWQERKLIEQLLAEFAAPTSETVIAYRNGARLTQAFEPTPTPAPVERPARLRAGGLYLITGGLGRVGLTLAQYLGAATRGKLVLVSRSPLPAKDDWQEWLKTHEDDETSRKIRSLIALEETGAEVFCFNADVTEQAEMQAVINQVEALGRINGVIHAAGIMPEQTFRLISEWAGATRDWVHDPKLQGLVVLESVLRGRELDFCLLMSSLSSVLGGLGYTTYAAANLFMDAFTQQQSRLSPVPWISVNWDAWGFDLEPQRQVGASLAAMAMTPEEGCEVFRRLLATEPGAQVVVSTARLEERIDRWIKLEPPPAEPVKAAGSLHPRPGLQTAYAPPETETERAIAASWQRLLGIEQIGLDDDFFALGGDSLLAVQLTARLRAACQVEIGPRDLFDAPTVAALARIVDSRREREQAVEIAPLLPRPRVGAVPLSFAQQQLWVVCQLGRGDTAYNIPTATMLRGPLNVAALEQSVNEIVRRHDILRACFPAVDGQPFTLIAPTLTLSLPVLDLRELPQAERLPHTLRLAAEEARQPFDLSSGPLLRARLARTATEEHVLLLTMHHIVTDGWSMGVLIGELAALYEAFAKGAPAPLPALTIQYTDFAQWQRQTLTGKTLARLLAYWQQQLGAHLPNLALPSDRPRSAVQTFRGATFRVRLPRALTDSLKVLSQAEGGTLFMTLLAAFNVLLRHYSGQDRVVVGTDVANRPRAEIEGLIGFFVNQLVLSTDLSGNPSFTSLLTRVREVTLGAFTHQELPFEMLLDVLKPERAATHAPLFQVKLVLQNAPQPPLQLSNLSLRPIEVENPYAKFDLLLTLWESEAGLRGTFEYQAELFNADTIEGMMRDYEAVLRAVVAKPDITLNALDALLTRARGERSLVQERTAKEVAQRKLQGARRRPLNVVTK